MPRYPEITSATFKTLDPHTILNYLLELIEALEPLLSVTEPDDDDVQEDEVREADGGENEDRSSKPKEEQIREPGALKASLELYRSAAQVLENGLKLLGFPLIGPPVKWD